ncbi:Hpt domain-containing protein [Photobacterium halotolerans]|uniref:Hpt domain-containing protein n=1 Tax=Photobacterium halotolerans TaxID=265726 RepID=UPI000405A11D|nr:Hpt domain-containing protein [Photobacterium halotolerans]NAW85598.1 Hpt domain-containing protein [Photobacterium halotolerans]NAX47920.1 Hpt domain-containing protein [Photobacterium halotolerans]
MTAIINEATLKRLAVEVGHETVALLLEVFSGELEQYLQQLTEQPSVMQIREISHAIKSSAASFGADELAQMAQECESRVKQGQESWVNDHLPELQQLVGDMAQQYRHLASDQEAFNRIF